MSAPTGNRYAEKWTYQRTYDRLLMIDSHSRSEDCLYLNQALEITGLYDDVWRYWRRKWRKQHEIIQIMKSIMQRFEVRLFTRMAKKEIPERVAMFALRHHYGWGKEQEQKPGIIDDLSYVDYELINERQQQYNEELARQQAQATQHTEAAKLETEPDHQAEQTQNIESSQPTPTAPAERVGHLTVSPIPVSGETFKRKLSEYNQSHPDRPVSRPAYYFIGTPPIDLTCTPYEDGYFVTPHQLIEAFGDL